MSGYAAHLRVYEPLGTLPDSERAYWAGYAESPDAPSRPVLMAMEDEAAIAALLSVPPRATVRTDVEHAYVRHLDGLTYVCPCRLEVRAWEALEEFRGMLADELAEAFLPMSSIVAAEADQDAWVAQHPDAKVGIRSATWSVPLPWFVLFEAEERRLVLGERRAAGAPPHTGLDRALVYVTAMSRARRRAARALHVVRRAFEEGPAVDALDEIGRWLEEFHPHSLVELDYGGLVHLLDDEALSADTSVSDVAGALEALARGDGEAAGELYEQVVGRWRAVGALEHAN